MEYIISAYTDIGSKKINQDAFAIKKATIDDKKVLMAILCDGMGGLDDGEVASEGTVELFCEWFQNELPLLIYKDENEISYKKSIYALLNRQNDYLIQYGKENGKRVGTTIVLLLIVEKKIFCVHVGDSRVYEIGNRKITQKTQDHSVVAEKVRQGLLTEQQAKTDSRRSVLTQCIGVKGEIHPVFQYWECQRNRGYLLCSDGFVHENEAEDIRKQMKPRKIRTQEEIRKSLFELTKHAKDAGEKDNITSMFICLK